MNDITGEIIPGDREGARPGAYRLPGADFIIHTLMWTMLLLGVMVAAYLFVGSLHRAGLVAADRDSVSRLGGWLVPAAAAPALLHALGAVRLEKWLSQLPMFLFVGVVLVALVPLAIVATVLLGLRELGVDTSAVEPALVLACHTLGACWAIYAWLTHRPFGGRGSTSPQEAP